MVDLQQHQDVLQQQLLKVQQVREQEKANAEAAPHERSLLSPKATASPASPRGRRLSQDSSASQSPQSKQTRPTLRGAGKVVKVPTTPLNSPTAGAEVEVKPKASAKASERPYSRAPSWPVQKPSTPSALQDQQVFHDMGLASALSNVPSRRLLQPGEEITELALEPPPPDMSSLLAEKELEVEGATTSEMLGSMANEADQEWWQRLHDQLEVMRRDVQDYAHRTTAAHASRFTRVQTREGCHEGMRLPVGGSLVASGESLTSLARSRSAPRVSITRSQSQPQNSWQPPMTPQTPRFEPPGLLRQSPQQELQRQDAGDGTQQLPVLRMSSSTCSWPRSPTPVFLQAAPPVDSRFVPVTAQSPPPTRRPMAVAGHTPVRTRGAGYVPELVTPRGSVSRAPPQANGGVLSRQSSAGAGVLRAPSAPPVVRWQSQPSQLRPDTRNVQLGVSCTGAIPAQVQYAALPSGGQMSWAK